MFRGLKRKRKLFAMRQLIFDSQYSNPLSGSRACTLILLSFAKTLNGAAILRKYWNTGVNALVPDASAFSSFGLTCIALVVRSTVNALDRSACATKAPRCSVPMASPTLTCARSKLEEAGILKELKSWSLTKTESYVCRSVN